MKKKYLSVSPGKTKKIAQNLAQEIIETPIKEKASVICLKGELGAGKTTFLQGFARGLGIKEQITSPTFVILKKIQLNNLKIKQFNNFYHIDCYRIEKPKELIGLGFKKIIEVPQNIIAIEWPDRIKKILPKGCLTLEFEFIGEKTRKIIIL